MKKIKSNQIIEYVSPILILSYLFIHNISLVFLGIIFSFYLINIDIFKSLNRSIYKKFFIKKLSEETFFNDEVRKNDPINVNSIEETKRLTLVEEIEELGFIPSADNTNDKNAA